MPSRLGSFVRRFVAPILLAQLVAPPALAWDSTEREVEEAHRLDGRATPHTPWARPLAGGPVRAYAFVGVKSEGMNTHAREIAEMAQRLDLDLDVSWRYSFHRDHWFGGDAGERRIVRLMKKPHDVFVFQDVHPETLGTALLQDSRAPFLEQVSAHTALGVMGAVAAPEAAALAGNTTSVANRTDASAVTAARMAVLGPQALREIARARQEVAAEAAAALETLKAKAAEAAASEKEELTETYERLRAEAAQVAEAELDRQRELFEAKTAAATAVAAAELADALSQAEERLAAAKAAAAEESETLAREAAEALKTAQARAAAEVEAAKLALEMGRIKAEEELAMARSAFLGEKQELVKSLREAEERAEKAKKAAIAAIGNL